MDKKVLVAMSGGVDSTVTVALLQQQGYQVVGVTMDIGFGEAASAGRKVADELKIDHYVMDLKDQFYERVIGNFLINYAQGCTPNPCVVCNKYLKFAALTPLMEQLNCDLLATGHYVQKVERAGRWLIKRAVYLPKDQSYFLYDLTQEALAKVLFPLGSYAKSEVRELARNLGLTVADKSDSQDICFIPDGDYRAFYREHCLIPAQPGPIIDSQGQEVGRHQGLPYYTVGQRRGLGLALGYPCYVTALDVASNTVRVGREHDLYIESAFTKNNNFLAFDQLKEAMSVTVKVRYQAEPVLAEIMPDRDLVKIKFQEPQKAVAPGQSAVFYDQDLVLGGGILL